MTSIERAQLRLQQIERQLAKHPRAARDGELLALLQDLADIVKYEVGACKCCIDNECECDGQDTIGEWHRTEVAS